MFDLGDFSFSFIDLGFKIENNSFYFWIDLLSIGDYENSRSLFKVETDPSGVYLGLFFIDIAIIKKSFLKEHMNDNDKEDIE